jgi:hypothetical protein
MKTAMSKEFVDGRKSVAGKTGMQTDALLRERVMRNLENAIERLNDDFEKIEFWAAAMDALVKPVPGYENAENRFLLPRKD